MLTIADSPALAKVLKYYNVFESNLKYKIICPFHNDVNPSLMIDLEKDSWFCFGCQKGGTAIDFIKLKEENISELSHWKLLNKIIANGIENFEVKPKTEQQIKLESKELLLQAKNYYFNLKTVDWEWEEDSGKDYLLERGLHEKTLNKVGAKLTYNNDYPIIFPMRDMGVFRGYVCRTTNKEIEQKRKYLYNKGFSRSNTVVGKYNNHTVFMVEGFIDYLKAKQLGIKWAVAILGWKITQQQLAKLKSQGVEKIICALDNDECGEKGFSYLQNYFNVVRFIYPDGIKDIGEMNERQFGIAKRKTLLKRGI